MEGDMENVCAAIYPTVGQEITGFLAVICDEERIPAADVLAVRLANEAPNVLPAELLKGNERVYIPLGGRRDFGLEIRLVWKR